MQAWWPATLLLRLPTWSAPALPVNEASDTSIVLAGTIGIGNSIDWLAQTIGRFRERNDGRYLFINPRRSGKLYAACEPGFCRYDNVKIACEHYGVPPCDSLDTLLTDAFGKL